MAKREVDGGVVVVGAKAHPWRDAYHLLLEMSWPAALAVIACGFLATSAVFGVVFMLIGGVAGAREGSFRDAFFFSVHTMGTIGYGSMYPVSTPAHLVVVAESIAGLMTVALATGVIFARFSRTTSEILFSDQATISPMDGVPTLSFRVGRDRRSGIFEARVTTAIVRTEHTKEGVLFYRLYDLELVRGQSPLLSRSFTVMHRITEKSPLFKMTPEDCELHEVEFNVSVVGTDATSLQPVHSTHRYLMSDVRWGARLGDILRELPDGTIELDVRKFHDTVPTEPTADFPYP